jgi:hypothetical protein
MRYLAWAATVILAAAVGWYARSAVISSRLGQSVSESETSGRLTVQVPEVTDPGVVAQLEVEPPEGAEGAESEASDVVIGGVQVAPETPADIRAFRQDTLQASSTDAARQPEGGEQAPPSPAPVAVDVSNVAQVDTGTRMARAASQPEERERIEAPQARRVAALTGVAAAEMQVVAGTGDGAQPTWKPIDEAEAAAILQQPVPAIDGLPVIAYTTTSLAGQQIVKVQQTLDSEQSVELLIVSDDIDAPSTLDKQDIAPTDTFSDVGTAAANSVVVAHGILKIRISASVPTDSLRALGERIRSR